MLVALAQQAAHAHPGDAAVDAALATIAGCAAALARLRAEREALEDRQDEVLQRSREREGALRFAIAELRFERLRDDAREDPAVMADLDYQVTQLEARVRELASELAAELAALDDKGIELAAAADDQQQRWLPAHLGLRAALAARLRALGAPAQALAARLDTIDGALEQLAPG
jgi:hypothetical protein